MSVHARSKNTLRRTTALSLIAAGAAIACLLVGATQASAAPRTTYLQSTYHTGGVNVASISVRSKTFDACYDIGAGGVSHDAQGREVHLAQEAFEPGIYKVTSFSVTDCQNGFGTAGSTGYINTRIANAWNFSTGHAPTRIR